MAFSFWEIFRTKSGTAGRREVSCGEIFTAAAELQFWELSFQICVNMIANAMGRCEFRTFVGNEETRGEEYYLWNIEPNPNQNATAFIHKLITRLYNDNEALVLDGERGGSEFLVVADTFTKGDEYPHKPNQYSDVKVGAFTYKRPFKESDVLHITLNHVDITDVMEKIRISYGKLLKAAQKYYAWNKGNHWKVKVDQMAEGDENFAENFQKMISEQFKPFLENSGAVLPEFDGYTYTNEGATNVDSKDLREMVEDIFNYVARSLLIPAVLVNGKIEGTTDANTRFLTNCIDPICDQLQEEIIRKRYGYDAWAQGDFIRVDSSSIIHFDLFANAANVEKLVGSGAFSINDVLKAANQATINADWADAHFLTLNITTMKEAARQLGEQEGGSNA